MTVPTEFGRKLSEQAAIAVAALRSAGLRLVIAESCTGGLLAGVITGVPGASEVLECGFVVYSNESKKQLLGVPDGVIAAQGAVSHEVARLMALGALSVSRANCAISITGIAGPGGSAHKPAGLVYLGAARRGGTCQSHELRLGPRDRETVRLLSVSRALDLLQALASGRG